MPQITINRVSGYSNKLRKIKLFLDGVEIDQIRDGESKTFSISTGTHKLRAKIDWCQSNEIEFDISEGEIKIWNLKGTNPLLGLYYITFGRSNYLKLEQSK